MEHISTSSASSQHSTIANASSSSNVHTSPTRSFREAAEQGTVKLFAQFGGQGTNYLDELCTLYSNHTAIVKPFVEAAEAAVKEQILSHEARSLSHCFTEGFHVIKWIQLLQRKKQAEGEFENVDEDEEDNLYQRSPCHPMNT